MDRQDLAGLDLSCVAINGCLPLGRDGGLILGQESGIDDIDHVVAALRELSLSEELQERFVAAMSVDDHDLGETVAGDLATHSLEQTEEKVRLRSNSALAMPRFQDLTQEDIREDDDGLDLRRPAAELAGDEQVCAKRQMVAVPFDARQGEQTYPLG
jgi:hypothetical protein